MADRIEIKMDFSSQDIQRQLQRLEERELPFAMALAATRTAKASQAAIKNEINRVTGPRRGFRTLLTFWPQRRVILQPLCMLVNGVERQPL